MIKILNYTPLSIAVKAGRTCWDSHSKGGCYDTPTSDIEEVDKEFLDRILNKHKHRSVAEHIRILFQCDKNDDLIINEFSKRKYFEADGNIFSTNLRSVMDLKDTDPLLFNLFKETLPEFDFLFKGGNE